MLRKSFYTTYTIVSREEILMSRENILQFVIAVLRVSGLICKAFLEHGNVG